MDAGGQRTHHRRHPGVVAVAGADADCATAAGTARTTAAAARLLAHVRGSFDRIIATKSAVP